LNRSERRRLEKETKTLKGVNKKSLEYREGIKQGIREERGRFVQALDSTKGIGDKLFAKVLDEVAKLYKGELL